MLNQVLALNAQFMMPSGADVLAFPYLEAIPFCVYLQQARAPKHAYFFYLTYKLCCIERKRKYVK